MKVFTGRPENEGSRSPREKRSYDLLDRLDIEYARIDHPPADNMQVCSERAAALGTRICKNIFLCNRQETVFYLLLMPEDKRFVTSIASKQLGVARLHFAREEHMLELLDVLPGSVSVLSLLFDTQNRVKLLIEREVLSQELFACHPCENTSSLRFKTSELIEKLLPAMHHEPIYVDL